DGLRADLVTGVQTCALPIFTVTVFAPMAMVPLRVPPSVPVPAVLESEKPRAVPPVTLVGLPPASCDCTVTGKPTPAAGFAPPLKIGRASCRERMHVLGVGGR